jgi:hypothetical protein
MQQRRYQDRTLVRDFPHAARHFERVSLVAALHREEQARFVL